MKIHSCVVLMGGTEGETWGRFERLRSEAKDRREDDGTVPMSHPKSVKINRKEDKEEETAEE